MTFILRILFSGLMVFVPNEDRTEVTVFLLNVNHTHTLSDDSTLDAHKPLLLARAGNCSGTCPTRVVEIAEWMYDDKSQAEALDALEAALAGGGAWVLSGVDIDVRKGAPTDPALPPLSLTLGARGTVDGVPKSIPTTSTERTDYTWLADLMKICADGCALDPAIFGGEPPANLVAARFRLRTGNVYTYSVSRIGSDVTPVHFKRTDGTGSASPYVQAVASWMGADIEICGSSVQIGETTFAGAAGRTMTLQPAANGRVEIAVVNLPPLSPPATPAPNPPGIGKHFEVYYDIVDDAPAPAARLVPYAGPGGSQSDPTVSWSSIHPSNVLWSDLLNQLRLQPGRTAYEVTLCPPGGSGPP